MVINPTYDGSERIYYLTEGSTSGEILFVNNSLQAIKELHANTGGFGSADDMDDHTSIPVSPKGRIYSDIKPGKSVLIDVRDPIFDSDFILSDLIDLHHSSTDVENLESEPSKGGCSYQVLKWVPLPEETLGEPEVRASEWLRSGGTSIPSSVPMNTGDLMMDYAPDRIAVTGLKLTKTAHREGKVTCFRFEGAGFVFQTCSLHRAGAFVKALKL